jgi:hypothetical protein
MTLLAWSEKGRNCISRYILKIYNHLKGSVLFKAHNEVNYVLH